MKIQTKLAVYNTLSKIIIILGFGAMLPSIIHEVSVSHIDNRLLAKKEKIIKIIERGDIREIQDDENCSFGNYNLLKEEFVSITPAESLNDTIFITEGSRDVGGEVFQFRILNTTFKYANQTYLLEMGEGLNRLKDLNKTLQNITLLVLLVVSLITFLLDIAFSRILLVPLKKIVKEKLRNTRHPSEFDFSYVKTTTSDFHQLDVSINQMMHKVQEAFDVQKEFIANVSHELLTPISILQNRFENMISEGRLPAEMEQKMLESLRTLSRLSKIIKTLLMISKIENDQYLKEDTLTIKEVAEEVLEEISDRANDKNIRMSSEFKENFELARCNKTLIFTMFFNLINNAIKYTNEGGSIHWSGKQNGQKYIVEISDTGIGIPPDLVNEIFNRFKRFKIKDNESYGLGLPIVKTIADFHQIDIKVISTLNVGTTIRLTF